MYAKQQKDQGEKIWYVLKDSDANGEFNVRWLNGASVHCCRYNIFMHIINHSCNQNIWKAKCGKENGLKKWEYE